MPTKRKKKPKFTGEPERPVAERGETLYTKREAANYLGRKTRWFNDARSTGIPHIKVGGRVMFRKSDLDEYISSRRVPAGR